MICQCMPPKPHRQPNVDSFRDWWFACTAIPLIAALVSPMANVFSICALITSWRVNIVDPTNPGGALLPELKGVLVHDPHWCYVVNLISLVLGFVGNICTFMNFGNRVRYVIALPMSILLYFMSACLVIMTFSIPDHANDYKLVDW
jgi:potassium channel subfamily K